jgi:hypothetical protein
MPEVQIILEFKPGDHDNVRVDLRASPVLPLLAIAELLAGVAAEIGAGRYDKIRYGGLDIGRLGAVFPEQEEGQ